MLQIKNKLTFEDLQFSIETLPTKENMDKITNLIIDGAISLSDCYEILNLYSTKERSQKAVSFFSEKSEIIKTIEELFFYDTEKLEVNRIYNIAAHIDEIIYLKNICKSSNDSEIDLSQIHIDLQKSINFSENMTLFYTFIQKFNYMAQKHKKDTEKAMKLACTLNELFSNTNHHLVHSLRGFYMMITGHYDKAKFSFTITNNEISTLGMNICTLLENPSEFCSNEPIFIYLRELYLATKDPSLFVKACENIPADILSTNFSLFFKFDFRNPTLQSIISNLYLIIRIFLVLRNKFPQNFHECCNQQEKNLFMEHLLLFISSLNCFCDNQELSNIQSYFNFYIGQAYHLNSQYVKATDFYIKSNILQSIICRNQITTYNLSSFSIEQASNINVVNVQNLHYFYINRPEKIKVLKNIKYYDMMKAKKSELFAGSALTQYLSLIGNPDVDQSIIFNNLVYFFYKSCDAYETLSIKKCASNILKSGLLSKKCYLESPVSLNSSEDSRKIILSFLCDNLKQFDDDITKYNYSFIFKDSLTYKNLSLIQNKKLEYKLRYKYITHDINWLTNRFNTLPFEYQVYVPFILLKLNKIKEVDSLLVTILQNENLEYNLRINLDLLFMFVRTRYYLDSFDAKNISISIENLFSILQKDTSLVYHTCFLIYLHFLINKKIFLEKNIDFVRRLISTDSQYENLNSFLQFISENIKYLNRKNLKQ